LFDTHRMLMYFTRSCCCNTTYEIRDMSNYIVLLKQVPDVMQITDNVFDPDTGSSRPVRQLVIGEW